MTMTCWPGKDNYFFVGVSYLKKEIQKKNVKNDFLFVQFEQRYLCDLLPSGFNILSIKKNIVLIASPELFSLALFYYQNDDRVMAVFTKDDSVNKITDILISLCKENKREKHSCSANCFPLTAREVYFLDCFIRGCHTWQVARKMNITCKTAHHYRRCIAEKMGVRKLEHLILNKNRRLSEHDRK